jgi:small GTP-binding protein
MLRRLAAAGAPRARLPAAVPRRGVSASQRRRTRQHRRWLSADATLQTRSVITAEHKQLVHAQRDSLVSLQLQLRELGAEPEDLELLTSTTAHLDELFLLCVVGEFNAGKSSLINALLGARHLEDGVTPTTDRVYLLKQAGGAGASGSALSAAVSSTGHPPPTTLELPVPWLEDVTLVDTPGTNAIVEGHAEITEAIIPRCDLLLFVTSVDRPISESERVFMSKISDWGKKVVVVVNKADMLLPSNGGDPEDLSKVLEFVRTAASEALRMQREKVEVFPVSARGALLAKEAEARGEGGFISPEASAGFSALESYILKTLSGPERLKMKLETPVQVASLLVSKYEKTLKSRLALVEADAAVIRRIESDLESYALDMTRDFKLQKAQVENVLLQVSPQRPFYLFGMVP